MKSDKKICFVCNKPIKDKRYMIFLETMESKEQYQHLSCPRNIEQFTCKNKKTVLK